MRTILYLALLSFATVTLSLKCVEEQTVEAEGTDLIEIEGVNLPRSQCMSASWCFKMAFDGKYKKGPVAFDAEGTVSDCADMRRVKDKCDKIGESCQDVSNAKVRPNTFIEGDITLCCCKTDLCNGSGKIVLSTIIALFVAFGFVL